MTVIVTKPQAFKQPDKITRDNKGIICEIWEIPNYSRYLLIRRNGVWSVYCKHKKRPVRQYTKQSAAGDKYHIYRMVSDKGKIKQEFEHRLVMRCLSFEEETRFVYHRNDETLDNRPENLYYYRGKGLYRVKNIYSNEVFEGNMQQIRIAAGICTLTVQKIVLGQYVKGFELISKQEF